MNKKGRETMKHITLFFMAALALMSGGAQTVKAQQADVIDVAWEQYGVSPDEAANLSVDDGYVYLYNVNAKKFINAGGNYGSMAICGDYGIPFKVSSAINSYSFESTMYNADHGSYLALGNINPNWAYIDRSQSYWKLTSVNNDSGYKIYNITASARYLTYGEQTFEKDETPENHKIVYVTENSSDENTQWAIIPVAKYVEVIESFKVQTYINVSGLVMNNGFLRNDNTNSWTWESNANTNDNITINPKFGTNTNNDGGYSNDGYADDYGAYGAAQIGADGTNTLTQTIYNLQPGLYAVRAQGFFYDPADENANSTGYLFATNNESNTDRVPFATLTSDQRTSFEDIVNTHTNNLLKIKDKTLGADLFRYNVPAAEFLADRKKYEPSYTKLSQTVYVYVTALNEDSEQKVNDVTVKAGRGYLTIGMKKTEATGYVFMDNVQLFFCGTYQFGHDAYTKETDKNSIDTKVYAAPHTFNLRRSFAPYTKSSVTDTYDDKGNIKGAWNAVVLPVSLTGGQVIQTFGEGVKLSKLVGVRADRPTQIEFDAVDVKELAQQGDNIALEAGEIYVVYVTKNATWYKENSPYTYRYRTGEGVDVSTQSMWGPVYHINGVARTSEDAYFKIGNYNEGKIEKTIETVSTKDNKKYTLKATGFFYRPTDGAPAGSYIITNGQMYHISTAWKSLMGTMWYLEVSADGRPVTNSLTAAFDGNGGTTGITSVEEDNASVRDGKIYDLQGRRVTTPTRGMYIKNGKKYIVK